MNDEEDEFLLTPRGRERFRPGFHQSPQRRFDRSSPQPRYRPYERAYSQRPPDRDFDHQRAYRSSYSQQRSHESYYQRTYERQDTFYRTQDFDEHDGDRYHHRTREFCEHDNLHRREHDRYGYDERERHYSQSRSPEYEEHGRYRRQEVTQQPNNRYSHTSTSQHFRNNRYDTAGQRHSQGFSKANSRGRDPPWLTTSPHKAEYGHPRHLSTYHDRDVHIKNKTTAKATTDQQANTAAPRQLNAKREQNSRVGKSSSELSKERFKKSQREYSLAENKFKSESSDLSTGEESNKNSYQGGDEKSTKDKKLVASDRKSNKHEKSKENAGENAILLNKAAQNENDFKPKLQKNITLKEVSNKSGEKKKKSESKSVSVLVGQKSENKHAILTPELTLEISKQILNSQNQDLNDNDLKLSKLKSISLSKPESRDSGGSSAFDFASSVFIDVGPKHKGIATKSDSKGKSSHKKNNIPVDSKTNHLKQKVSENETRCKELHNKLVESDCETDEELDRFKNILSKVHDAKWKTKPLILDRRRSSTQSNKSTDSSASISILQPKQEIQHGSKKAFKKYGVKNVELRGRKLFFKGIHIKQPSVNITKQDTQNIIWYRNTLKRKLNKNRNTCSKFKRIRVSKHSSSDSDKCKSSARSLSSSNSSSEEFSSSSFRALSKSKEFQWIVPDSYESDMTDRSNKKQRTLSQRQTSHTKEKEKKKKVSAVHLTNDVEMSSVREKTSINSEDYFLMNDCSTTASDMITDQVSDCNEKYVKPRLSPKSIGETKEQTEKVLKDKKSVKSNSSKSIEESKVQTEKVLKDKKSVKSSSSKSVEEIKEQTEKVLKDKKSVTSNSSKSIEETKVQTEKVLKDKKSVKSNSSNSIGEIKVQTEKVLKDKKSVKSSSTKSLGKTKEQIEMVLKGSKSVMSNFSSTFDKNIDILENASSRNLKDTDKSLRSGSTETKFKSSKNDIIEEEHEKDSTDLDKSEPTYCSNSNFFTSLVQPCPLTVEKMECTREAAQFKKQSNANMISPAIRDSDTVTEVPETEVPETEVPETEFSQHQISSPESFPVFQTSEHQPIECSPNVNLTKDSEVSHVSERDSTNLAVLKAKKSKSITQSFKKFQSKLKIYQQRKKTDKKLKSKRKKHRLKTQGVWDSDETGGEGDIEDNILNESQTEPKHFDLDSDNENDVKDNVLSEVQIEPKHLDLDCENEKQIKSVEQVEYSEKEPPSQMVIHQEAETMQIESGSSSDVLIHSLSEEENVLYSLGSRDCHKTVNSAHCLGEIKIEDSEKSSASDEETVISLGNVKEEAIDIKDEPECFLYSDKERVTHANNVKEETTCIEIKDEPEHFLYSDEEKVTGAKNLKEEAIEIKEEFENNSDTDKEIGLGLSNWKGEAIETKETEKSSALDKEMAVRHNNVKEGAVAIQETEMPSDSHIELTVGLKNVKAEKIKIKEEPEISSDSDKEMNVTVDLNEVKEEAVEIKEEREEISDSEKEMVIRHNVKEEAFEIKEEPAWSKFSYSQEPDTIFLSDNDVVQVDSDSDDELLYSAQRNYSNSLDNDIEDPEYYDFFSSPENCSGSEAEDSDQLTTTFKTTKVEGIKSESADENTNDISLHTIPHETNLKTEADSEFQGLSESESSDDELDYYEIDCHDSDSLLEIETNFTEDRKVSSPAGTDMKKSGILPVTDPYETLTTVDSFDPYGVETQTTLSPNNKRVKSIMSATLKSVNHQKEPSIGNKVLEKSSFVTPTVQKQEIDNDSHEPVSEDEQRDSSIKSPETQEVNLHKPFYEENTQVDMHVNEFNQINKGKKEKAGENIQDQLDDSDSFSDSSLIDAADKQIHLYTQAKGNNKERRTSRFADGLEIKYVEGMFEDEIEGASNTQVNLTNKEFLATSSSDETPIPKAYQTNTLLNKDISTSASDDDISAVRKYDKEVKESLYLKMTQIDVNENYESSLSEPEEEGKAGQDPYMALTQIENIMLSDGEDIFHYLDDQVELTGADNESSSRKGFDDKNKGQLSDKNKGKISDIVSGEPVTNDWYSKNTQIDDLNDSVQTIDDSITTQGDEMNDSIEIIEENIRGKSNDVYSALTQKIPDTFDDTSEDDIILNDNQLKPALDIDPCLSDKEREKNMTDMYLVATQIDVNQNEKDSDSDWSTADEDLYTNMTQVDSSVAEVKNTDVLQTAQTSNNIPPGRKTASDKNEQEIKLGNIKNKLKQSGSDRKTIEIPMANEKSFFERKFSRQISQSSTMPKSSEVVAEVGRSTEVEKSKKDHITSDSEMLSNKAQPAIQKDTPISTNKFDKWLSKGSGKLMISPAKPPAKRKRRATAGDDSASSFKKKIEDARKQLADRNYQTIFHPESKADHQRKQKSETATEMEDVDLPTCSQIVSKGLPVLNPTGMLVKKNQKLPVKPASRFSSRAASLTETMVEGEHIRNTTNDTVNVKKATIPDDAAKASVSSKDNTSSLSKNSSSSSYDITSKDKAKLAVSSKDTTTSSSSSSSKNSSSSNIDNTSKDKAKLGASSKDTITLSSSSSKKSSSLFNENTSKHKAKAAVSSKETTALSSSTSSIAAVPSSSSKTTKDKTILSVSFKDAKTSSTSSKDALSSSNSSKSSKDKARLEVSSKDSTTSSLVASKDVSSSSSKSLKDKARLPVTERAISESLNSKSENLKTTQSAKECLTESKVDKVNSDKKTQNGAKSNIPAGKDEVLGLKTLVHKGDNAKDLKRDARKLAEHSKSNTTDVTEETSSGKNTKNNKENLSEKKRTSVTEGVNSSTDSSKGIPDKSQSKATPTWGAAWMEAQKKPEKTAQEVGVSESYRSSNKDNSRVPSAASAKQNVPGKPNTQDPRQVSKTNKDTASRVNLMLKTPLQSPDLARVAAAGTPMVPSNVSPKPFQTRQSPVPPVNQTKAPTRTSPLTLIDQTKGITFKEFLAAMLKWNPIWFDEHAKLLEVNRNAEPPPCTHGLPGNPTLYPLTEKYKSFQEYSDNFMVPLLLYETWESSFQTIRERQNRRTVLRHKLCLSGVHDGGDKLNDFILLGLMTERERGQGHCVCEGDLVTLNIFGTMLDVNNKPGEKKWVSQLALVEKVIYRDGNVQSLCNYSVELGKLRKPDSYTLKMILKTRGRKFKPDYSILGEVVQIGSVVTTLRQFKALESFPQNPLCGDILWPTNNETYFDKNTETNLKIEDGFNPSQLKAITTAAKMVSQPSHLPRICLLQGPPGTGKSHTVLGIINQILKDKQKKVRICLCAQSHAAVDELIRRLDRQNIQVKRKGVGSTVKLIRIGKQSSVHKDVQYLCLDNLIQKNIQSVERGALEKQLPQSLQVEKSAIDKKIKTLQNEIKTAKELKRKKLAIDLQKLEKQRDHLLRKCKVDTPQVKPNPERECKIKHDLLDNADVIAGTLSGFGGSVLRQYLEGRERQRRGGFDCLIIDEATQAIELDTLIPLQYGITKLILVGDPEQLPPTVVSQVALNNKFNLSLFERLNSHFRFSHHNPVVMLDTQYRMDPEICYFPSNYIYDGKLKTDRSIYGRSQCPLVPYLLYDVADGREQMSQCSGSVSNPVEAKFTVRLCEFITTKTNVTANVIGIIAPYQKQKTLLVQNLQKMGLRDIEVSTVDGFQGREKHVIIMSCVRAMSSSGTIGFVGNRNRMNVSLTRAKYALYVVAHFDSLERSDEWKALIEDAEKRRKRIPVNLYNLEVGLRRCLKKNTTRPS